MAGCPMAAQIDKKLVSWLKEAHPDYTVVAYINTTSEVKTLVDVCVTSSSAVKIISNIDNDKILFVPDRNLGQWVAEQCPNSNLNFSKVAVQRICACVNVMSFVRVKNIQMPKFLFTQNV